VTPASRLERINAALLEPFVRKALSSEEAMVARWDCDVIKGTWTPPGRIVCHLTGQARSGARPVPWSLYLRIPEPPMSHRDPVRREPFHRDLMLYGSGILDRLPDGIAAPRLLGVTEHPDDEPWMWFEDAGADEAIGWPQERFGLAAFHLGRMHGAFLESPDMSAWPRLDRSHWSRQGMARMLTRADVPAVFTRFEGHPLTNALWDTDLGAGIRRLWSEREAFAEALDGLPRTLCHGDFCMPNLMSRLRGDGEDETVLIDWQYAGWSQIGADIAGLIADSSILPVRRKVAEPEEFTPMMLEAYLSGLRDAGCGDCLAVARFACLAALAFRWAMCALLSLDGGVLRREPTSENRAELEQRLDASVRAQQFLLGLAEEAREFV